MKKFFQILFIIFFISNLCSCTKNKKNIKFKNYTMKKEKILYTGYIDSISLKSYVLNDAINLKVMNGDIVEKGQELFTLKNNTNTSQAIKLNNKLKNIKNDIKEYNNKIVKLDEEILELNNKISSSQNESLKNDYKNKKEMLNSSIEEIKKLKKELERTLEDINIDIKYENNIQLANFKGQVTIKDNILNLYSTNYQIVYNATQEQVSLFQTNKEYPVNCNNKQIGIATLKYIIPNDDLTTKGTIASFKIVFNLVSNESLLRNSTIHIIDKKDYMLIPKNYVKYENKKYFVKINSKEKEIKLQNEKSSYKVINGLQENDILESYEVNND